MSIHIICGFIIPWILGLWLIKDKTFLTIFYPAAVALATTIDIVGTNYFWQLYPLENNKSLSHLPNLTGLYPITSCLMLYLIYRRKFRPFRTIFYFAGLLTILEWLTKEFGLITYFNGWNIYWTFISYITPLTVLYLYSKKIHTRF